MLRLFFLPNAFEKGLFSSRSVVGKIMKIIAGTMGRNFWVQKAWTMRKSHKGCSGSSLTVPCAFAREVIVKMESGYKNRFLCGKVDPCDHHHGSWLKSSMDCICNVPAKGGHLLFICERWVFEWRQSWMGKTCRWHLNTCDSCVQGVQLFKCIFKNGRKLHASMTFLQQHCDQREKPGLFFLTFFSVHAQVLSAVCLPLNKAWSLVHRFECIATHSS